MDLAAALAAVAGGVWLWTSSPSSLDNRLAVAVYVASLVGLFTVSAAYHSIPWRPHRKWLMQRVDHSMIFVLVAGSYTPFAWIVLDGWLRLLTLLVVWGVTVAGVVQKVRWPELPHTLSISMTAVQGWFGLALLVPLVRRLPLTAMILIVAGGLLYTVAMVCLITRRPALWPRVFSYHEAMHVLVIAAAVCHFVVVGRYVTPLGV